MGPLRPQAPGFTFVRTKVNRKSASPLRAGPPLLPNRTQVRRYPVATEIPLDPRNRCGELRTSPVGPRDEGYFCFSFENLSASPNPGSSSRKTRWRYPFNRATAEAGRETRRRSDPRRTRWFCGNRVSNFIGTDWTKGGGPGSPRRFFPPFLGGQKWGRRRHAGV